jgi:hypothetical protein
MHGGEARDQMQENKDRMFPGQLNKFVRLEERGKELLSKKSKRSHGGQCQVLREVV